MTSIPHKYDKPVDVCFIVEGCYPFITGGVSSWLDWLIRSMPDRTFGVVAITADEEPRAIKLDIPGNLKFLQILPLSAQCKRPLRQPRLPVREMARDLTGLLDRSDRDAFSRLVDIAGRPVARSGIGLARRAPPRRTDLLNSAPAWDVMLDVYKQIAPSAPFADFFWAWRSLVGGLFATMTEPVPQARAYHAISTGYAGLFGAVAAARTGRPLMITEHGIYTNERRIDLIMADWIPDTIDRGYLGLDARTDIRDFWTKAFSAFASIAYASAHKVTTLYAENQLFQRALGATDDKMVVIPNGVDLDRFANLPASETPRRPTVALIGRVVPIKDIEAFIIAASHIRRRHPDVEVLVIGPTDEDPAYYEACKNKVHQLGLRNTVRFTGKVDIVDYLGRIDVMVLTSISEAQPLVLLEAGAARIPCVVTDVGSCGAIIDGSPNETPRIGPGGLVVPPMSPLAVGEAVNSLLGDDVFRLDCGTSLRKRVERYYTSEVSSRRYDRLYEEQIAA